MKCNDINVMINDYLDGLLNEKEMQEFNNHIENCEKCKLEFEEIRFIHEIMADSELSSLPENFEKELSQKLEKINSESKQDIENEKHTVNVEKERLEKKKEKKIFGTKDKSKLIDFTSFKESRSFMYIKNHQRMVASLAALLMIGVFTVTSMDNISTFNMQMQDSVVSEEAVESAPADFAVTNESFENKAKADLKMSSAREDSTVGTMAMDNIEFGMAESVEEPSFSDESSVVNNSGGSDSSEIDYSKDRLIIKNGYASIEVLDFDKTISDITNYVTSNGGYVSDMSSSDYGVYNEERDRYLKSGYVNIRIPKNLFDSMFEEISTYGNVQSTNIRSNDITDSYRSTADEVINLEIREKKLREIMEKTVEIKDVIEVERELSRVRGEINRLQGTLQNWEALVELSSVNIEIREVKTLNKYVRPVDATLFEQAKFALIETLNNLMLFVERFIVAFIGNIPNFIIIGFVALVLRIFYKKRLKG